MTAMATVGSYCIQLLHRNNVRGIIARTSITIIASLAIIAAVSYTHLTLPTKA